MAMDEQNLGFTAVVTNGLATTRLLTHPMTNVNQVLFLELTDFVAGVIVAPSGHVQTATNTHWSVLN